MVKRLQRVAASIDAALGTEGEKQLCLVAYSALLRIFRDGYGCTRHTRILHESAPANEWRFEA